MMESETVKEINSGIEQARLGIKNNEVKRLESNKSIIDLETIIKGLEINLRKAKIDTDKANMDLREANRTIMQLARVVSEGEDQLKKDAHEKAIQDLFDKQPHFWEALEVRMEYKRKDLALGMVGLTDITTKDVIEKLQSIHEGVVTFGEPRLTIRSAFIRYDDLLQDICKRQIEGRNVPTEVSMRRTRLLDAFILSDKIAPFWT
jgi:hypothetical protein